MSDPYERRTELIRLLNLAVAEIKKRGRDKAEAERAYRVALAKKMLIERDSKTPVTIINDICRGDESIAALKFNRDVADTLYDSAQEAVNCYKLELRVMQEDLQNERRGT